MPPAPSQLDPISPSQFTLAIQDLPLENLYTKARELNNSIAHLRHSNRLLREYADGDGDRDCLDAIEENEGVIERQKGRIGLLKGEAVRRGQNWHGDEVEGEEEEGGRDGGASVGNGNGVVGGDGAHSHGNDNGNGNGTGTDSGNGDDMSQSDVQTNAQVSGRLTDDELRRQIEAQYPQDDADDEDGMHL